MTDQQREKYAIARDKPFDEQWAELEFVVDIMNRAKKQDRKPSISMVYVVKHCTRKA